MPSPGRRPRDRLGWASLDTYLKVHERYPGSLRADFVVGDNLVSMFVTRDLLEIRGRITCRHGLFGDVRKTLEMDERRRVRTFGYSYHAGLIGSADRPILRHGTAHAHPGHPDAHHKHVYDHRTWDLQRGSGTTAGPT